MAPFTGQWPQCLVAWSASEPRVLGAPRRGAGPQGGRGREGPVPMSPEGLDQVGTEVKTRSDGVESDTPGLGSNEGKRERQGGDFSKAPGGQLVTTGHLVLLVLAE